MKIGKLNTHFIDVDGLAMFKDDVKKMPLSVRFTSDEHGETISISIDGQIGLLVPYEPVKELIEQARNMVKFGRKV